jgi:hypothetical protein
MMCVSKCIWHDENEMHRCVIAVEQRVEQSTTSGWKRKSYLQTELRGELRGLPAGLPKKLSRTQSWTQGLPAARPSSNAMQVQGWVVLEYTTLYTRRPNESRNVLQAGKQAAMYPVAILVNGCVPSAAVYWLSPGLSRCCHDHCHESRLLFEQTADLT